MRRVVSISLRSTPSPAARIGCWLPPMAELTAARVLSGAWLLGVQAIRCPLTRPSRIVVASTDSGGCCDSIPTDKDPAIFCFGRHVYSEDLNEGQNGGVGSGRKPAAQTPAPR